MDYKKNINAEAHYVINNFDTLPLNNSFVVSANNFLKELYKELDSSIEQMCISSVADFHHYDVSRVTTITSAHEFPVRLFVNTVYSVITFLSNRYNKIFDLLSVNPGRVQITFNGQENFSDVNIDTENYIINLSPTFAFKIMFAGEELFDDKNKFILGEDKDTEDYKMSHIHSPNDLIIHSIVLEFINFVYTLYEKTLKKNPEIETISSGITALEDAAMMVEEIISEYGYILFNDMTNSASS